MILGALEAGGTKMVCGIGNEQGQVFKRISLPTGAPEQTMAQIVEFFRANPVQALGVGSFGPLDLSPASPTFGAITTTPKLAWQFYPLYDTLKNALQVPVGIDTDVNAACYGEYRLGAGQGKQNVLYVTIGTGIGAGVVCEGNLVHGLMHPEFGHTLLRPHAQDPMPQGVCPFHDGCGEGLASGPSMQKRWGIAAPDLPDDHIAWQVEAYYLAQMCVNAICTISPQVIVLGGGVPHRECLFPLVRAKTLELLGGYIHHNAILQGIDSYIVPPALGDNAGAAGSLLLAADAFAAAQGA